MNLTIKLKKIFDIFKFNKKTTKKKNWKKIKKSDFLN